MVKVVVKDAQLESARKMLEQLGIKAAISKPEDIRNALVKTLKNPDSQKLGASEVVRENGMPEFVFHKDGGITAFEKDGRAYLFISDDGAGFVRYRHTGRGARVRYFFYRDSRGSVERTEDTYIREFGGEKRKMKLLPPDYTKTAEQMRGEIDEFWLDVNKILKECVTAHEGDLLPLLMAAGMEKK